MQDKFLQKVLCIGDSLALPGHLNKYEDTWLFKLKKEFPQFDFITFFKRQLTTDALVTMGGGESGVDHWPKGGDCLEAYIPDVVIVQLGIVDCAPRLLHNYERKIVNRMPISIRNIFVRTVKSIRNRAKNNTVVSYDKFQSNISIYLDRSKGVGVKKVVFIGIPIPDEKMIKKNPDIVDNINLYNSFLIQISEGYDNVTVLFPLNATEVDHYIYEDGYHPNSRGHDLIKNQLTDILCQIW